MAKSILDRYEEAHAAFMRGSVHGESDDQLLEYLSGLANQNNTNTGTQHAPRSSNRMLGVRVGRPVSRHFAAADDFGTGGAIS